MASKNRTHIDWLANANLMGLSGPELAALSLLYEAASEWSEAMAHCHDANNFNGALHRAVDTARAVFGELPAERDAHFFCNWKCVAGKGVRRCARDQPTTFCPHCGIESPTKNGKCSSCSTTWGVDCG